MALDLLVVLSSSCLGWFISFKNIIIFEKVTYVKKKGKSKSVYRRFLKMAHLIHGPVGVLVENYTK